MLASARLEEYVPVRVRCLSWVSYHRAPTVIIRPQTPAIESLLQEVQVPDMYSVLSTQCSVAAKVLARDRQQELGHNLRPPGRHDTIHCTEYTLGSYNFLLQCCVFTKE